MNNITTQQSLLETALMANTPFTNYLHGSQARESGQSWSREDIHKASVVLGSLNRIGSNVSLATIRENLAPGLFDHALTTNLNAILLKEFSKPVWQDWKKIVTTNDYIATDEQLQVRLGGFGDDLEPWTGRLEASDIPPEEKINFTIDIHGELFVLPYETAKSDHIKALASQAQELGRKYSRGFVKKLLQTHLQANPNYGPDSVAIFNDASHANDLSGNGVGKHLTYANVHACWKKLAKQTRLDGSPLGVTGAYILCGVDNATQALAVMESENNPDNLSNEKNTMRTFIKGVLWNEYLGEDWYLVADPSEVPSIHVGFLKDFGQTPEVKQEPQNTGHNFVTLEQRWRAMYPFGFAWSDYRGVVRGSANATPA